MKQLFFLLFLTGVFLSCKKDKSPEPSPNANEPGQFIYPLKEGNSWTYNTITTSVDLDSKDTFFNQTINSYLVVSGLKTLSNGAEAYEIHEIDSSPKTNHTPGHSRVYFQNRPDGLYSIAYTQSGRAIGLRRGPGSFQEVQGILRDFGAGSGTGADSLIIEKDPRKVLVYPFALNTEWSHLYPRAFPIRRKVVGWESVKTPAGAFLCYKIKHSFDTDWNGIPDSNFVSHYYISAKGLIKISSTFHGKLTDATGNEIGNGETTTLSVLTSFKL
jgi:hypothetical protein